MGFLDSLKTSKKSTPEAVVPGKVMPLPPPPAFKPADLSQSLGPAPIQTPPPLTPPSVMETPRPKLTPVQPLPTPPSISAGSSFPPIEIPPIGAIPDTSAVHQIASSPAPVQAPSQPPVFMAPTLPTIPPVPKFEMDTPQPTLKPLYAEPAKPVPMQQVRKDVPKELPSFPVHHESKSLPPVQKAPPKSLPEIPDMDVPEPPPNLRSELSPLELEKLEQEYLGKRVAIKDVEPAFEYNRHEGIRKPLFIRTDEYRKMLNAFMEIKEQLIESDQTIFRVENIKKNQDTELNEYKRAIEDIQRKLIFIDKTIFEN